MVDEETGEILLEANDEITAEKLEALQKAEHRHARGVRDPDAGRGRRHPQHAAEGPDPRRRRRRCTASTTCCARASRRAPDTRARSCNKLFFNPKRYDLARVGRYKLNQKLPHEYLLPGRDVRRKLGLGIPDLDHTTLCREDFIAIIKYLLLLRTGGET